MQRFLTRSCLALVLAAPLLCQAEAAEALAHSLAELADRGVIEASEPGDAADIAFMPRVESDAGSGHLGLSPSTLEKFATALPSLPDRVGRAARPQTTGFSPWPPSPTLQRQAFLQRFLL